MLCLEGKAELMSPAGKHVSSTAAPEWRNWSIEELLQQVNKHFGNPAFPDKLVQDSLSIIKGFALRAELLESYSVEKLEMEGIKTSVATAVVSFIAKQREKEHAEKHSVNSHLLTELHKLHQQQPEGDTQNIEEQIRVFHQYCDQVGYKRFITLPEVQSCISSLSSQINLTMTEDRHYFDEAAVKQQLGTFYKENAAIKIPFRGGKIVPKFFALAEPASNTGQQSEITYSMKDTANQYSIWISPSGMSISAE
jgi:ribosomal protein S20